MGGCPSGEKAQGLSCPAASRPLSHVESLEPAGEIWAALRPGFASYRSSRSNWISHVEASRREVGGERGKEEEIQRGREGKRKERGEEREKEREEEREREGEREGRREIEREENREERRKKER